MINIRSWGTHCPVLFTTEDLEQAQEVVRLFGLGDVWYDTNDVWYDTNNDSQKLQALKGKVRDLKDKLSSANEEIKDLNQELEAGDRRNYGEADHRLKSELQEANRKLGETRAVVCNLGKHVDLLKSIIHSA